MKNGYKGILGYLRRWLSHDQTQESLARQILYLRQFPLGRRIKGRLISGSRLLLRMWELGGQEIFKKPSSSLLLDEEFETVVSRVAKGEDLDGRELLPYLCAEGTNQRAYVNMRLAEACSQVNDPKRLCRAQVFAERAWVLSGFAAEMLPLYEHVLQAVGDAEALREAYKRIGIAAARQGSFMKAIKYFDRWQYAYHNVDRVDRYSYDFDICHAVEEMARPYRFSHTVLAPKPYTRIRIAHLVRGIVESNSNLVKIGHAFARHHNKERFDMRVFVPETDRDIDESPQGRDFVRMFERLGCKVVTAGDVKSQEEALMGVATKIYRAKPHLLLTSAAFADFSQAFLTALRPAPLTVGLVQGPPPQFAPPWLDWSISWSKHPLLDTPVNCSHVEIKLDWASHHRIKPYPRSDLGLPAGAFVMMSAGRHPKFQDSSFWRMIQDLLNRHSHAHFIAVGPTANELPLLDSLLSADARSRVQCLGWRQDVLALLASADVLLDTYPNGGGQVLVEAMTLGLPIVAHRNDYLVRFDQNAWSPAEDFIDDPDLIVTRGDFVRFQSVVERIIVDEEFRRRATAHCKSAVSSTGPAEGVRKCEEVFLRLLGSTG